MIKFDFIVSDEEGSTIFECITEEIERMTDKYLYSYNKEEEKWYKGRIEYLKSLKKKMKNSFISSFDKPDECSEPNESQECVCSKPEFICRHCKKCDEEAWICKCKYENC